MQEYKNLHQEPFGWFHPDPSLLCWKMSSRLEIVATTGPSSSSSSSRHIRLLADVEFHRFSCWCAYPPLSEANPVALLRSQSSTKIVNNCKYYVNFEILLRKRKTYHLLFTAFKCHGTRVVRCYRLILVALPILWVCVWKGFCFLQTPIFNEAFPNFTVKTTWHWLIFEPFLLPLVHVVFVWCPRLGHELFMNEFRILRMPIKILLQNKNKNVN